MDSIKIEVVGNVAKVTQRPKRITSGTVGLTVEFSCDKQWDNLTKTAVFRAGNEQWKMEDIGNSTTVPWEVLRAAGPQLFIGLYGKNEGDVVAIPTVWVGIGLIREGANPDECDPAKIFPDTLDGTIEDYDVLEGEIGYANGERVVGKLRKVRGVFTDVGEFVPPEGCVYDSVYIDVLPSEFDTFIIADEYGNEAVAVLVEEDS